jgi:histidinol phosphatase-like enzyme
MHQRSKSMFPPLPGTERAPRGLFVDRWGTLLKLPACGVCARPDELEFRTGVLDALFRAHRAGWNVYLIGNEDAVADGRLSRSAWAEIEGAILARLVGAGALVKRCYACLEGPGGSADNRLESVFRLPNTGALYHATHTDGIELRRSWVIGDSTLELVAGWRSGCRLAGVRTGLGLADGTYHVEPEIVGDDLAAVLGEILATESALRA